MHFIFNNNYIFFVSVTLVTLPYLNNAQLCIVIKTMNMGIFDFLTGKKVDYKELKEKGAIVIDVRSPGEFQGGNVNGSKNIPLDSIEKRAEEIIKMNKPIVLCCASGNRSGMATRFLSSKGVECYNGGSWTDVQWNWID